MPGLDGPSEVGGGTIDELCAYGLVDHHTRIKTSTLKRTEIVGKEPRQVNFCIKHHRGQVLRSVDPVGIA